MHSPEQLLCDNVTSPKKQFLQERAAHRDNVSTGDMLRSCNGQKDSDEPQFSATVLNGWFIALMTEVASFCQTRVWGFCSNRRSFHSSPSIKSGGKKANTGISELLAHYKLFLCPVLSVAAYHSIAGTRVPAEGGLGAFSPVGVRISLYFST